MTRAQYIAMCLIGGVALAAFLQSYEVARALRRSGMVNLQKEYYT